MDPAAGLSAARARELLDANGPNALPEEKAKPGWRRFLDQYRSYMQIILLVAAVVSLLIQEWSTGVLLLLLTVVNAVVGLRQEGKAESAMNALKSMMKATARVRRDGADAEIPAEQLVVGDVVLLAAGDQVPADGRIVEASALQIDESALTGESVPAVKDAGAPGRRPEPGRPVEHGVHEHAGHPRQRHPGRDGDRRRHRAGQDLGHAVGHRQRGVPADEGAQPAHPVDRGGRWSDDGRDVRPRPRPRAGWDALFVAAVSLAIAAIPEALPTVTQVILSLGSVDLAGRNAIVKDLPSVETLGYTSAINSDKTGTLTMNQMTAVEVVDPTDRFTVTGTGYGLDGSVHHAAGASDTIEDAVLPVPRRQRRDDRRREGGGRPHRGRPARAGHKAGLDVEASRERLPRLAALPFDPGYKLMATFNAAHDATGRPVVRCFVKGAAPAVMARAATALSGGRTIPWDAALAERAVGHMERMERDGRRVMAAAWRDLDPAAFDADGDLLAYVDQLQMTSLVGMVDPPREQSRAAVADAQAAHIRVRMVTGDDVTTGAAIAEQLGIPGTAILGAEFAALSETERLARIDEIGVVGRVAPEHKVLLATTLKAKGDVVAMTGDGVNDAPAIKAADIGIAMGSGTDVAKNAGRMILTDDNFATIVFAVGRGGRSTTTWPSTSGSCWSCSSSSC